VLFTMIVIIFICEHSAGAHKQRGEKKGGKFHL
jgi:hypothetical protein